MFVRDFEVAGEFLPHVSFVKADDVWLNSKPDSQVV